VGEEKQEQRRRRIRDKERIWTLVPRQTDKGEKEWVKARAEGNNKECSWEREGKQRNGKEWVEDAVCFTNGL
jgi:hypothetical protein